MRKNNTCSNALIGKIVIVSRNLKEKDRHQIDANYELRNRLVKMHNIATIQKEKQNCGNNRRTLPLKAVIVQLYAF